MVGPVLMEFGTPVQQRFFLPKILTGEHWWCQGYSEPGAGSDLAALSTRAVRRGDRYVVNGQKTWTTLAQHADWMFCLVRTDPEAKKQEGISFLLIDMKAKGVTVRPIRLLDGSVEVNEVFLDEVEVPVEQRVGEENQGWTIAKYLLEHERTGIANVGINKRELARAKRLARECTRNGRPLIDDPLFAARLAEVEIELMALDVLNLRVLAAALVVAGLLAALLMQTARIRRSTEGLLETAAEVGANTANIPQLEATAPVLAEIFDEAVVQDGYMNALTDGPDLGCGRQIRQRLDRIIGHHIIKLAHQPLV